MWSPRVSTIKCSFEVWSSVVFWVSFFQSHCSDLGESGIRHKQLFDPLTLSTHRKWFSHGESKDQSAKASGSTRQLWLLEGSLKLTEHTSRDNQRDPPVDDCIAGGRPVQNWRDAPGIESVCLDANSSVGARNRNTFGLSRKTRRAKPKWLVSRVASPWFYPIPRRVIQRRHTTKVVLKRNVKF